MNDKLKSIMEAYSKEFGVPVEFDEMEGKFVTDDGQIRLQESPDKSVKLHMVEPLDEANDDQLKNLSKIRRHFSGYLKNALEAAAAATEEPEVKKETKKEVSEKPAEKTPSKRGRPPKTTVKTELTEPEKPVGQPIIPGTKAFQDAEKAAAAAPKNIDPPDEPIEKPPIADIAEDDEENLTLCPACDREGKVLPEIYKLMKLRGEKQDLIVVEENLEHLVLEGEYGSVEILADGTINSEVAGYVRILSGAPPVAAKPPASTSSNVRPATSPTPNRDPASAPAPISQVPKSSTGSSIYDQIINEFGPDLLEVFGETGTMKSQGMVALAKQCAEAGKAVYYLDTENNISPKDVRMLREAGVNYHYTPVLKEIDDIFDKKLPNIKADVIIVDSVGMPVLRKFSAMSAHDRGTALLDIIKWLGVLKEWTYLNKSIAFVTNQPQSEFGKSNPAEKGDHRMPFGDKSNFIPGALLLAKKTLDSPQGSVAAFQVFRLRNRAWGEKIFEIKTDKNGSTIKMVV